MKLKSAITSNVDQNVVDALCSEDFAVRFLTEICGEALGAEKPTERPAEYYVQLPDITVPVKSLSAGVETRLTGLTRGNRTPKQFHEALKKLHELIYETVKGALKALDNKPSKIQIFCVIMLDGDVETAPGSGIYSNVLESEPTWVTAEYFKPATKN